jgi:hypothetical protein
MFLFLTLTLVEGISVIHCGKAGRIVLNKVLLVEWLK